MRPSIPYSHSVDWRLFHAALTQVWHGAPYAVPDTTTGSAMPLDIHAIQTACGLASAAVALLALLLYLRDAATGRSRPHRAGWAVWAVLVTVSFASAWDSGTAQTLAFVAAKMVGTVAVAVAALVGGRGPVLRTCDVPMLGGAALGLMLWAWTDEPGYALGLSVSISLLAGLGTIRQAWTSPERETPVTWIAFLMSTLLALAAVPSPDPMQLAYPLYLLVLYGAVVGGLLRARARPVAWVGLRLD